VRVLKLSSFRLASHICSPYILWTITEVCGVGASDGVTTTTVPLAASDNRAVFEFNERSAKAELIRG
jgi:hypothetical protein